MATQAHTFAVGSQAGERLRYLAKQIEKAASVIPDSQSTGASVVITFDNTANSVQITGGPFQNTSPLFF